MNSTYHFEAHKNYIRGIDEATCRFMSELTDDTDLCKFITHTPSCHEGQYLINYLDILFCKISSYMPVSFTFTIVFLLSIHILMLLFLACLAFNAISNILCIVKNLSMDEHNAGSTILVLANGLPDIFTAFFFFQDDTELLINEMLGTGIYLRAFHAGVLLTHKPLTLLGSYFMRDSISYLLGMILLLQIMADNQTSLFEGLFAMTFYPFVCIVVYYNCNTVFLIRKLDTLMILSDDMKHTMELTKEIQIPQFPVSSIDNPLNLGIFEQFIVVVDPMRSETFENATNWQKTILKIGIVYTFAIKLIVPVVNLTLPGDGWSKLLLSINFFLSPLLLQQHVAGEYLLLAGTIMGILFYFIASHTTPKYQFLIAAYGCVVEMVLNHLVSTEALSILVIIGNILGVKRSVIGTTLLAWGNTIPEIVIYFSLLNWNIKVLAFTELLMAPLLNIIFAIGLTALLKCLDGQVLSVVTRCGDLGGSGMWFNFIHHLLLTFAAISTNFHMRKSIGYYSIMIYLVHLLYTIAYQFDFLHAYETDHVDEEQFPSATWA